MIFLRNFFDDLLLSFAAQLSLSETTNVPVPKPIRFLTSDAAIPNELTISANRKFKRKIFHPTTGRVMAFVIRKCGIIWV